MSELILFEDHGWKQLLPLTYWRSLFELRVGRKIILDRTAQQLGQAVAGIWCRPWMANVARQRCGAPANSPASGGTILVNARWLFDGTGSLPQPPCVGMVDGEIAVVSCDEALASRLSAETLLDPGTSGEALAKVPRVSLQGQMIRFPWDLIRDVGRLIEGDWHEGDALIDGEVDPASMDNPARLHVGQRSHVHRTAVLDSTGGPIYLSHDVHVGALAVLQGPLYVGPGTRVHPRAYLHGGNAIGPVCRIAGEVHGCVIDGYSNKQHEGFLGHSYVGSWVNLGAGCTNSDLKNTYGSVRVRLPIGEADTGETFLGSIIGDHAKVGINASLPTGCVIGMAACVATTRLVPSFVPSFGWLAEEGLRAGDVEKLLDVATRVMARRDVDMTDEEVEYFLELGRRCRELES
ncbi:MAG: hypothetical protein J5J06_08290 [Phycisphaerae bacterium]|nr:hypothetical protein [Phycisphaerae bacterium]